MPEGDTVWLAGRRLAAALTGHTLVRGELRHPQLSTLDLAGVAVRDVVSVGKHILVRLVTDAACRVISRSALLMLRLGRGGVGRG